MRIAYLTQSYPPMISGAALVVERLAKSMAERGHQVLVIAASNKTILMLLIRKTLRYYAYAQFTTHCGLVKDFYSIRASKSFRP